jgi:hypothetical protein
LIGCEKLLGLVFGNGTRYPLVVDEKIMTMVYSMCRG